MRRVVFILVIHKDCLDNSERIIFVKHDFSDNMDTVAVLQRPFHGIRLGAIDVVLSDVLEHFFAENGLECVDVFSVE
jgi:hypothetical protein